mgnify:CR=1 FL=1
MKCKIQSIFLLLLSCSVAFGQDEYLDNQPPNIVLILVDDAGLMEFGAFGGEARTPNIDELTGQGMMFTNFHASPVCAPSRAMLLTGTDSHLAGVANLPEMLPEGYDDKPGYAGVLNNRVQTIATRLKEVGYNTYATGKWHLGHDEHTLPTKRGFDRSFILGASGADNYEAKGYLPMKATAQWYADGEKVNLPNDFYSSKDYINQTIEFHEAEKNDTVPFFSYIAFQAIHAPIQAPKKFVEPYLDIYKDGWDVLRQKRFEKAKELSIIPKDAKMNDMFPQFKKWKQLSQKEKNGYAIDMAVMAGMLEAMDYHIGRYVNYLKEKELFNNTVFIIASDNGPDGGNYNNRLMMQWAKQHGYHKDINRAGEKGYYGAIGTEFAHALASPFSFFKYYAGEGGVRVPLIISGKNIPKAQKSNAFCFITDIVPTILEMAGMEPVSNKLYNPITGNSILPHIQDVSIPIYKEDEGVGLEAANNAAYYQGDFKIVKNNIPLGDGIWYMYNLKTDPGETKDISKTNAAKFQTMLAAYDEYAKAVGVIEMEEGYAAAYEVGRKSVKAVLRDYAPYLIGMLVFVIGLTWWIVRWRRLRKVT